MKTIMVSKRVWQETRKKCSEGSLRVFDPDFLFHHIDALTSRDSAVSLISSLRMLGLLDENAELTKLGRKWARESTYAEACQNIIADCFPAEITDALARGTDSKRDIVERYAIQADMNSAGAEKNIRFLNMLIKDARRTAQQTKLNKHKQPSTYMGGQNASNHTEEPHAFSPKSSEACPTSISNVRPQDEVAAEITIMVPKHKAADALREVIAAIDMPEASINVRIG